MKRLLVPLCAVTGCNWVFGLEQAVPWDARDVETLPPGERTKLVWAIATTDGMPTSGIDPVVITAPIGSEASRPDKPTILIGDDNALAPAEYTSDGSFEIPFALRESPHRIVYTLPGESVPHEVQWALTGATLTVPRTTRLDAPRAPDGSGYTIAPMGRTNQYAAPAIYTSGVATYTNDLIEQTGAAGEATLRFMNARPLAGPLGAPQVAQGDWVLLGEFASRSSSLSTLEGWALGTVDLMPNQMTAPSPQPMWNTASTTLSTLMCPNAGCLPAGSATAADRLANTLGALADMRREEMGYGVSPSTELPGFVSSGGPIERPLIFPFAVSTRNETAMTLSDPSSALAFKRVVYSRFTNTRVVDGVALTSSLSTMTDLFVSPTITFPAPLAVNMKLGTVTIDGTASDGVPVPASSSMVRLSFEAEQTMGLSADDYVVTLYEITGTSLAPVRYYHVLQPGVQVDGSLLVTGHKYVFGINARSGYNGADRGDYLKATYPFSSATTFTRTFVIQ